MSSAEKQPTPEVLMRDAHELLAASDFEAALRVGERLKEMRWSGALEVQAKAYAGLGNLDEAKAVLDEGVSVCPDLWILWMTLGIYRSDSGDYPGAHEALDRALECPNADEAAIRLNIGIVLEREGKFEESLEQLQLVTDQELRGRVAAARAHAFIGLGRCEEALRVADAALGATAEAADDETSSLLHSVAAEALFRAGGDKEQSLRRALRAAALDSSNTEALWWVRELRNERSADCRYFRILAEGEWDVPLEDGEGIPRFFASFDVVAESPEEALVFIRELHTETLRETLRIAECTTVAEQHDGPKGVYRATGYHFYPSEGED